MSQTSPPSERPEDPGAMARRLQALGEENALLRRRLEESRQEAQRLRTTAELAPIPMFTKDPQGRYTWCNAAFEAQAGQRREHFVGKTVRDILPPAAAEFHEKMDREMFARPSPQSFEYAFRPDKGDNRQGLFLRAPLLDGGGKLTGLVCAILDLTERKAAEEALRLSEERLKLILRHSSDGINIAESDPELKWRKLVMCNDRFVQMSGRTREELMAAGNLNQFIRAYADQATHEENLRKLQDGTPIRGQGSWIRPDGKENYYEWTGASTRIGDRLFLIGIDRDVTERHLADRALRESEEKYRTVVEAAGDLVSLFDENGTYLFINSFGAARHGLTPREVIGKTFWDIYPKDVADARAELVRDVIRTGQPFEGEVLTAVDGRELWDQVTLRPLPGAPGSPGRVLGVAHDVTARIQAQSALRRREESERYLRGQLTKLHLVTNELSTAASFDELCRQAVVLGRSRLGFDRLGLWFTGKDPKYLEGSYGTDESGLLRDEHTGQAWLTPGLAIAEVVRSRKPVVKREGSRLFDASRNVVGQGQAAVAALWDGQEIIGCLATDTLLSDRPLSDDECEVLRLYASALGHLCSRKRSEEAMRRSEDLYRTVVESAGAAICQFDVEGTCLFMNVLGARWLKMEPAQTVGKTMWDLFPKEYADGQMETIRAAIRQGRGQLVEVRSVTAGAMRWLRVSVEPLAAPPGEKPRALVFARDITDRKNMEQALDEFNRRLRGIVENSWDVIFEIDLKGNYVYTNPAAERLTGYGADELVGTSLFKLVAPEYHQIMRDRLRRRQSGAEVPQPFQFEVLHRDGRRVFVELVTAPVMEAGVAIRVQGIARDITDRLRAERELRETRRRLEHLIAASPAVIYCIEMTDPRRMTYVSPNVERICGYAPAQMMDHAFWDQCLHPDDHELVHQTVRKGLSAGEGRMEYRFRHADGTYHWMLDEFNVVRPSPEAPLEAVGHVVDITPLEQAQEALAGAHRQLVRAREEERKRLAGELHDSLGQELISLHLKMQGLLPDLQPRLEPKHSLELDTIVRRCQEAIANVRAISHGLFPPLLESVGLAAALREMASRLASPIPIKVDCAGSLEKLRWPPDVEIALFRIAQEALRNAVGHSQASRIKLALEYKRGEAVLSIRDDGVGFDPGALSAGLGLSTMRDRARTVGGDLLVESRAGSTRLEVRVPAQAVRKRAGG